MSTTDQLTASYSGTKGPLFGLAFKTSLLTMLTLGIYRFWAKTRIRKYIWSSINIGGDRLEYTGTGLEKFLGFLVAVVVLAVYLGLVQLAFFYFGLHFVFEPTTEAEILAQLAIIYGSFIAILPLILFASYRARRYILARTRFRGIRFGMDSAAWGYVWRAIGHGILTALTLGILLPRQTYWLEKYKTDRSHFGDQRFEQGGKWTALYPAMTHVFIGLGILVAGAVSLAMLDTPGLGIALGVIGYIWLFTGYIHYGVQSFAYLMDTKKLGDDVGFVAKPRTGKVIGIYLLGGLIVGAIAALIFGAAGGITAMMVMSLDGSGSAPSAGMALVPLLLYVVALVVIGTLGLVFISQPIIAHFVETLSVFNPAALDAIGQRAYDKGADAEGFADALDVGAAI
ncbi:MAG: DUF898 family protein [Albidovulum sp.]